MKVFEPEKMIKYISMFILNLPPKPPVVNQVFIEVAKKDNPQNCYTCLPPLKSDNYGGIFIFNSGATGSITASDYSPANTVAFIPQTGVYPSVESELHLGVKKMERTVELRELEKV